jgi:dethiobiotin synthetase
VRPTDADHADDTLRRARCLMVLGTGRGVGKSVVTGGLAVGLRRAGVRVNVFKPVSVGCRRTRQGLVSADVEFLAHCADSRQDLATLNPIRFRESFLPVECSRRRNHPIDQSAIEEAYHRVCEGYGRVLVEAVGGLLEPLDDRTTMLDLAAGWKARFVVVASASAAAVNAVLMAVECVRRRNLNLTAILLNRYEPDSAPLADEINPEQIATHARVDVPLMIPRDPATSIEKGQVGEDIVAALRPLVLRLTDRRA